MNNKNELVKKDTIKDEDKNKAGKILLGVGIGIFLLGVLLIIMTIVHYNVTISNHNIGFCLCHWRRLCGSPIIRSLSDRPHTACSRIQNRNNRPVSVAGSGNIESHGYPPDRGGYQFRQSGQHGEYLHRRPAQTP